MNSWPGREGALPGQESAAGKGRVCGGWWVGAHYAHAAGPTWALESEWQAKEHAQAQAQAEEYAQAQAQAEEHVQAQAQGGLPLAECLRIECPPVA